MAFLSDHGSLPRFLANPGGIRARLPEDAAGADPNVIAFPTAQPSPHRIFKAPVPHLIGTPAARRRRDTARTGPARRPLGAILTESGALDPDDLARAVALQAREDARFGDILLAHGMVTPAALYAALAEQHDTVVADLDREPPDTRLVDQLGADFCIRHGILPWKRVGGATVVICSRPDTFAALVPSLPQAFGRVRLAIASDADIQSALVAARHRDLAGRAETRVAEADSCRTWKSGPAWRFAAALFACLAAVFLLSPFWGFALLTAWAIATLIANTALKLAAAITHLMRPKAAPPPLLQPKRGLRRLPTVSIMVPLFKEREIAGRLVMRLAAIDYPRELLDICLVVEEDDTLTQATLARTELPRWMRQIIVPRGAVRTKPRALNFALDFCRGSIIGVYDAEDAPAPDQIHTVARRFADTGPEVACLQGVLDFYNARKNWLSRAFTVEYATWFRIILPGLARMGFAVPLGGTTLFFRRAALESLGGWDAHNVTEDADLGIRLARRGYRTELIDTVTREEANCRAVPWVKQRSRWIKGYAITWAVHMRRPRQLLAELGPRKFFGFQLLFLGSLSQFMLAPLLWSFWAVLLGLPHPIAAAMPPVMFWSMVGVFIFSELFTIAVGTLAVWGRDHRFLVKWVPTLHVYWPLATLAAIKAMVELVTKPFYWDKTQHGRFHV